MVKDSNQQILDHSRGSPPLTNPALAYYRLVMFSDSWWVGEPDYYRYVDVHDDDDVGPSGIYVKHYLHPLLLNILIRSIRWSLWMEKPTAKQRIWIQLQNVPERAHLLHRSRPLKKSHWLSTGQMLWQLFGPLLIKSRITGPLSLLQSPKVKIANSAKAE